MKKLFLIFLLTVSSLSVAQEASTGEPIVRPRDAEESSSFMGDPDPLDPLPVRRENLKDDEEPVLEDIRQVLNAPSKKKKQNGEATPAKRKKPVSAPVAAPAEPLPQTSRADDEPDLRVEKKFNQIYKKFNATPTSEKEWYITSTSRPSSSYEVQRGDTLWSISRTLFGDPQFWPKIWSLNREQIENPHFIYPGDTVKFFAGSALETPGMAVESREDAEGSGEDMAASESADISEDANEADNKPKLARLSSKNPAKIPDSLPLYRNDRYHLPPKVLKVELKNLPKIPDNLTNDILLTDKKIASEVELKKEEMVKGRCGGEHVIHVALPSSEGELVLFEPLETLDTDAGNIYSYRRVGVAQVLNSKRIKITSCASVLTEDLVFISPSKVSSYRTNKTSNKTTATLIGGPGLGTQKLFSNQQRAYLNLGTQAAEVGQSFSIKSQLTEQQSGEVRVIDKFGSFAIGLIIDVQDLVETGDELFVK